MGMNCEMKKTLAFSVFWNKSPSASCMNSIASSFVGASKNQPLPFFKFRSRPSRSRAPVTDPIAALMAPEVIAVSVRACSSTSRWFSLNCMLVVQRAQSKYINKLQ
jgi:hypothetical protein